MIDINELYESTTLFESKAQHVFDNGDLTFADIRDILTKVFAGDINMQECVDGADILITYKDGQFKVACTPKALRDPIRYDRFCAKDCKAPKEMYDAFASSMKDLSIALSELDPVNLNRYFANGQNYMSCRIVYPPAANLVDYGNKCFIVLNGIKCYNDKFKEVGEDSESAQALFELLAANGALRQETFEITRPNLLKIKNSVLAKDALEKILAKLNEFIDGVGWKCSINQYIQDRYSRHIVNKALENGIDVSRNSDFVNSLAARLSQVSGRKPTKSDLITYAKCDGVDYRTDAYKKFVSDLEQNAEQTNSDIVKPIEDLIMWAGTALMKNVVGFMSVDPSRTAKKLIAQLVDSLAAMENEECASADRIALFKKNLSRIDQYAETMPAEGILIRYKGKVYKLTGAWGIINQLLDIVKYK